MTSYYTLVYAILILRPPTQRRYTERGKCAVNRPRHFAVMNKRLKADNERLDSCAEIRFDLTILCHVDCGYGDEKKGRYTIRRAKASGRRRLLIPRERPPETFKNVSPNQCINVCVCVCTSI